MAISSYPTPVDAGVLCIILANTAVSISILKETILSILQVFGIHFASLEELSAESTVSPSESYMENFRNQTPTIRYDSIFLSDCARDECSICLTDFEPHAEIHRLSCGHVFHNLCLQKWLKYWKTTCPLCRTYIMPHEAEEDSCPM